MPYFIGRDKYFTFTENVKEDNKVNKLTIPVLTSITDPSNTIFKTSTKHSTTVVLDETTTNIYGVQSVTYPSWTETYQSSYDEVNKYKTIYYRILGLPVTVNKTVTAKYGKVLGIGSGVSTTQNTTYGVLNRDNKADCTEADWEVFASGTCPVNSSFLVSVNASAYSTSQSYTTTKTESLFLTIAESNTSYKYYDDIYVEIYGNEYSFNYANIIKESDINNRIKYNYSLEDNPFIQEQTTYSGKPITDYISETVFKNYDKSRPVATLEWIGSPEVDYGTDLQIEPRRQYNEDELIVYTVVGKDITYNGGYREKLYLIKKEAD